MAAQYKTAFATFDGANAQAFIFERGEKKLSPMPGFPMSGPKKPVFEDVRPRTFESVGSARSATEKKSDPEQLLERDFVIAVATKLEALRCDDAFGRLIVAAGPRALGYWRKAAPAKLAAATTRELAKDYAGMDANALLPLIEEALDTQGA